MTNANTRMPAIHDAALLLPWYAGGTLDVREQQEVEQHLNTCAECRTELESVTRTRRTLRAVLADEAVPEQRMHEAVMTSVRLVQPDGALDGAAERSLPRHVNHELPRRGPFDALAQLSASLLAAVQALLRPRWAAAAAIMLIAFQAGTIVWLSTQDTARRGVTTRAVPRADTTRIRIVFDPHATERDIRSALQTLGGRIVDGPTTTGVYVVELPAEQPAALGRKIRELRDRPGLVQQIELVPQTSNALR